MSILVPFFSDIVGLVGAIGFWPTTVFFPIECWIRLYRPSPTYRFWLRALNVICALVTVAAAMGSIYNIIKDASKYEIFGD